MSAVNFQAKLEEKGSFVLLSIYMKSNIVSNVFIIVKVKGKTFYTSNWNVLQKHFSRTSSAWKLIVSKGNQCT